MHTNAIIVVCHCPAYNKTPRPLKMQPIQWVWCGLTTPKHSQWNNNPIKVVPWSSGIHPIPTDHEDTHQCQRTICTCRGGILPPFEIVRCHAWSFRVSLHDWVILRSSRGKIKSPVWKGPLANHQITCSCMWVWWRLKCLLFSRWTTVLLASNKLVVKVGEHGFGFPQVCVCYT
jgi:hypothetical protein